MVEKMYVLQRFIGDRNCLGSRGAWVGMVKEGGDGGVPNTSKPVIRVRFACNWSSHGVSTPQEPALGVSVLQVIGKQIDPTMVPQSLKNQDSEC